MAASGAEELTLLEAAEAGLADEMRGDPSVFVIGFEASARWPTVAAEFGAGRVRDTPIAELGTMGLAVGAARRGLRPVVDLMGSTYIYLALDQVVHGAASTASMFGDQLPCSLVLVGLSGLGEQLAGAHHAAMPHPLLMSVPGLTVVFPSDPATARAAVRAAVRDPGPVVLLLPLRQRQQRAPAPPMPPLELGRAAVRRPGRDLTVVAIGPSVAEALEASRALAVAGISVEVVEPVTLSPLDLDTIVASAGRTRRLLVVDEAYATCSAASEICARVSAACWSSLLLPPRGLTVPDVVIPFAPEPGAYKRVAPHAEAISAAARAMLEAR